jgi:hypothetical protein
VGHISSVIDSPADTRGGDEGSDLFFKIGFHGGLNQPTELYALRLNAQDYLGHIFDPPRIICSFPHLHAASPTQRI